MLVTTVLYTWIIPVQLRQVHTSATPSLPAPTNSSTATRSTYANSRLIGRARTCTGSVVRKQRAIGCRAGCGAVIGRRHGAWIMPCKRTESRRNHCPMQPHNLLNGISSKKITFISPIQRYICWLNIPVWCSQISVYLGIKLYLVWSLASIL